MNMTQEKFTKPDAVIELTAEQIAVIEPLLQRRGADIVGIEIYELAYQKIEQSEEKENVESEESHH